MKTKVELFERARRLQEEYRRAFAEFEAAPGIDDSDMVARAKDLIKSDSHVFDARIFHVFDGETWADCWLMYLRENPDMKLDRDAMAAWFADALICGYQEAMRKVYMECGDRTNQHIVGAIEAGIRDGGNQADWDAPEFAEARRLTGEAGCEWDFTGWQDALESIRYGMLGGVQFCGVPPYTDLSGYVGLPFAREPR